MSRQEILCTSWAEMMDMISCLSIYEGNAKPKGYKKWKYEDAIALR